MTPPPMTASDPESDGIFAPFAGMIRIRFDGKDRLLCPLSAPLPGLPCRLTTVVASVAVCTNPSKARQRPAVPLHRRPARHG